MAYVFSLCSATDACPFLRLFPRRTKEGRRKAEPHIGKRGAQLLSPIKYFFNERRLRMQSNPHKLTVIDGETLMDKRLPPTKFCVDTLLPQVTLFLLLSQIPSLTSLAFLRGMWDETLYRASFAFVLRPPKRRPQRPSGYAHTPTP